MSPREAEAVAVAADALDGAGDPAALVVALVAELARRGRLPENEVAVVLAGLVEGHPEGAGLVRLLVAWRPTESLLLRIGSISSLGWVENTTGGDWSVRPHALAHGPAPVVRGYPTQEAAEAALIAAQPEPRAVVRVPR